MKYLILILLGLASIGISAQGLKLSIATRGMGRTTGHIAELSATNREEVPVTIAAGYYYVPATGRYQAYVVRIPGGTTIEPGETAVIAVTGFCVAVDSPPVPFGIPLTDFHNWVLVTDTPPPGMVFTSEPTVPEPMNPPGSGGNTSMETILVPDHIHPSFDLEDIADILGSSGFSRSKPDPEAGMALTFPGTSVPLNGYIDLSKDPLFYAALIVGYVIAVEGAVPSVQANPNFTTPYHGMTAEEHEIVVQHVVWLIMARLSGATYTIEEFRELLAELLVQTTGATVSALPEEEEESFEVGVTDFWNTFTAVGIEAKVFRADGPGISIDYESSGIQFQDSGRPVTPPQKCDCEKITFDVVLLKGDVPVDSETEVEADSEGVNDVKMQVADLGNNQEYKVRLTNIEVFCECEDAPAEDNRCDVYPPVNSSDEDHDDFTNSDRTRDGTTHDQVGILIKNDGEESNKENLNASQSNAGWTDDTRTVYEFTLTTKEKGKINGEVSQRFEIIGRCESDDCGGSGNVTICDKVVRVRITEE